MNEEAVAHWGLSRQKQTLSFRAKDLSAPLVWPLSGLQFLQIKPWCKGKVKVELHVFFNTTLYLVSGAVHTPAPSATGSR